MIEINVEHPQIDLFKFQNYRYFVAESIKDMQTYRDAHAEEAVRKAVVLPFTGYGSDPSRISHSETSAFIFLPEVQHYPAFDPRKDNYVKGMFGLFLHDNIGMRLTDSSAPFGLRAWYDPDSYLMYPYPTIFSRKQARHYVFSKARWMDWRESRWEFPVVLLAQYTQSFGLREIWEGVKSLGAHRPPIVDQYWLIDIIDPDHGHSRRGRRRIAEPEPIFHPAEKPMTI